MAAISDPAQSGGIASAANIPQPGMNRRSSLLLAILAGALGAGFLWWSLTQFWSSYTSKNWPATQGKITESRFIDHGRRRDGELRIRYDYSVQSRNLTGNRLLAGNLTYTDKNEKEKANYYKRGMVVPVYYDPANPESSALEVGVITRMPFIGLILGLMFGVPALYIVWCMVSGRPVRL
jgi:hypothetical protein